MTYTPKGWTIERGAWVFSGVWVAIHDSLPTLTAPTRDGLLVEIARVEAERLHHLAGEI